MINISKILRIISLGTAAAGFLLVAGGSANVNAQGRDPFAKPSYERPKSPSPAGGTSKSGKAALPVNYGPPSIEARIDYYKRLREAAAAAGSPIPKVTSVLLLNEMTVTGIFKTPRGWAAMVEATPIKLSYTVYPGDKFFDGQLVAVEENRLTFRKVTKTGPNKFVASVENKPLQTYTTKSEIEGTAPAGGAPKQTASSGEPNQTPAAPVKIISPLDEMNQQPAASDKNKSKKDAKRPVKVAKVTKDQ